MLSYQNMEKHFHFAIYFCQITGFCLEKHGWCPVNWRSDRV
jgi:hypothetical protein